MRQEPLELRDWKSEMSPDLRAAQEALARAIGEGRVHAWGRPKPHALIEQIPSDPFRIPGLRLVVNPHGDMGTLPPHKIHQYEGPRWHMIEFDPNEIKREWARPPPLAAQDWMLKEAKKFRDAGGPLPKREFMLKDCMDATQCTKQEAEAAHKRLPQEYKRPRGRPPKDSG